MIPPPACQDGVTTEGSAYVYLLRSSRTGRFYLGWTTDLRRRLEEHASGLRESSYTRSRGPWQLVAYEVFDDAELAKRREWGLKHNPRMLAQFKKRTLNVFRTAGGGPSQVVG